LIDNAQKFTPEGGRIRLAAAPSWDGRSSERPAYVAVSVEDDGIGFDPQRGEHLFEQFYRIEGDQAGLGIGLTIARALCQAMGGHLWAESSRGTGATFTFILPVARVGEKRAPLSEAEPSQAPPEDVSIESWIEQTLSFDDDATPPPSPPET
jgi:signal transduction histidine kinase